MIKLFMRRMYQRIFQQQVHFPFINPLWQTEEHFETKLLLISTAQIWGGAFWTAVKFANMLLYFWWEFTQGCHFKE